MARFRYAFAVMLGVGWLILAAFLLYSSNWSPAASEDWFAFTLPWDDGAPSFVGPWLETPAGAHGFVQAGDDGDFHFEDGQQARFWGVELGPGLVIPPRETAETLAARLAKLGFNLVRVSSLDLVLFDPQAHDTRHLDPTRLEQLDYLVYQLKSHGIYVDIVLSYHRRFRKDDGVIDWDASEFTQTYEGQRLLRSMAAVDPYLLKLQKEFAKQLLTHRNPYTGHTYANEPAIAMLEITNETTLTYGWLREQLNANAPGSIHVTSYYSQLLDRRWNIWLQQRYESRAILSQAWQPETPSRQGLLRDEDPTAGTVGRILYSKQDEYSCARVDDILRFYSELERKFFEDFSRYLKRELDVKAPISGTHTFHGMVNQLAQGRMDFTGGHVQWQHPLKRREQSWRELPLRLFNTPMVKGQPQNIPYKADWIETRNTLFRLAYAMTVAGKPFVISEYNHAFPNEYQAEFPLILSAYSSFQRWDGAVIHQYAISPQDLRQEAIRDVFFVHNNPIVLVQMPVASLMFRRGDVKGTQERRIIHYTEQQAFQSFLECGLDIYCVVDGRDLDPRVALEHGVANQFGARSEGSQNPPSSGSSPYISDTGELSWDLKRGRVLIDTDYVQGAVGFLKGQAIRLKDVTIEAQTDFAAIALVSLDGRPIRRSEKLLLTATSRVRNQDMVVERDPVGFYLLSDWGHGPIMVQDVRARLSVRVNNPDLMRVFRLDERGQLDLRLETALRDGNLIFEIGGQKTLWYGLCATTAGDTGDACVALPNPR